MKKNVLALSIAAMIGGFAGAASAQTFPNTGMKAADATALTQTDGGAGHILLVPYYNAQNSNMSVLHVVNTDTTNGKAIKVRFRGAANSDDVLDFTVFLSPGDVWTGAVTAEADGVAKFTTSDKSCTLPSSVKDGGVNFSTARLAKSDDVAGTKEGYIEILNMADIVKGQATVSTADVFASAALPSSQLAVCRRLLRLPTLPSTTCVTGRWAPRANGSPWACLRTANTASLPASCSASL